VQAPGPVASFGRDTTFSKPIWELGKVVLDE
jgi:hypothetical protein